MSGPSSNSPNPQASSIRSWLSSRLPTALAFSEVDPAIAFATALGAVRPENQDRVVVARIANPLRGNTMTLLVVADGIAGGRDGGEAAALACVSFVEAVRDKLGQMPLHSLARHAALAANDAVYGALRGRGGTTLAAILVSPSMGVFCVSVGDTRVYAATSSDLIQVTTDDTIAARAAELSQVPSLMPLSLLQFIGMGDHLSPNVTDLGYYRERRLLILTDGVYGADSIDLLALSRHASDPTRLARRLITYSEWTGGHDNASCIIAEIPGLIDFAKKASASDAEQIELWSPKGLLVVLYTHQAAQEPRDGPRKKSRARKGKASGASEQQSEPRDTHTAAQPLVEVHEE